VKRLTIERFIPTEDGVIGVLEPLHLYTLEEELQANQRSISAIPAGVYRCARTVYQKHGFLTFEIMDVPGRSRILFHPGNTEEDTEGCVLVGGSLGSLVVKDEDSGKRERKLAVLGSQVAFRRLMSYLDGEYEFELEITGP
jgi:hypothetical protein